MEQFIMKGGNPLVGEVTISGAKNAALGILAASILTDEDVLIENLPDVRDINVFLEAVSEIGAMVDRIDRHTVRINAKGIHAIHVDDEYIRRIRASYYFIGALLGKYKSAQVPLPGGCNIGSRPIDQHLKGFRALGAKVQVENGAVLAHAIDLVGTHIYLDMVSVGATINIMMAATLAEGETIIENPAKEPHVVDVANFLNSMGANVKGAGTFVGDKLVGWIANIAHHSDIGGKVPGSTSGDADSLFQEGIRIPVIRIRQNGKHHECKRGIKQPGDAAV